MAKLLTADEVCDQIGMSKDWVYGQVRARRFPAVQCGRYYRFKQADVDAWIALNTVGQWAGAADRGGSAQAAEPAG